MSYDEIVGKGITVAALRMQKELEDWVSGWPEDVDTYDQLNLM